MATLTAVLLAAGEGLRFNSKHPKLLHPLAGWPMLDYGLAMAEAAGASKIYLVVPSLNHPVAKHAGKRVIPVAQSKPLGSADAVKKALQASKASGDLLVLYGDVPLLRPQTVQALRQIHQLNGAAATLVTAFMADPFGYGRVVRGNDGSVIRVVEEKDCNAEERKLREINGGAYLFQAALLGPALDKVGSANAGREFYLPEVVQHLIAEGKPTQALTVPDASEVLGVNTRQQAAAAHRILNRRRVAEWERKGVTFLDAKTTELGPDVELGRDTVIEGNVKIEGATKIGEDCLIESGSLIVNSKLGKGVSILASRIIDSVMADDSDAGPNAHVRGGCVIGAEAHVGTGTEMKGVKFGADSKAGHFSYIGDAVIGKGVNVGAGCVFANYDGKKKHVTKVGDGAFLGSNSTLVAPVTIGSKAVVGAGAVVTKNVPAKATVVGVPAKAVGKKK